MIRSLAVWCLAMAMALCGAVAVHAQAGAWWQNYEHDGRMVSLPGGRRIKLYCEGLGGPIVILDSGSGEGAAAWRFVQDDLARHTEVCAYDRAGLGFSDAAPGRRDTLALVSDFEQMLRAAHLVGPYILVGHALGADDVRLFASRHPTDVAGMVLVDPATDDHGQRLDAVMPGVIDSELAQGRPLRACAALARAGQLALSSEALKACGGRPPFDMPKDLVARHTEAMLGAAHFRAMVSEFDNQLAADPDEVSAGQRLYGNMPLIVLTAEHFGASTMGLNGAEEDAVFLAWNQMHVELAGLSAAGVNRVVPMSGHWIQLNRPWAVVDAVDEVVGKSRQVPECRLKPGESCG